MPIYFQPISENLPFSLESIGNHWLQDSVSRKQGYAHYHWLQTESGQGHIQLAGQLIALTPGQGVLLPPFTPHAYFPDTGTGETWHTRFATINGLLTDQFPKILGTNQPIFAKDNPEFSYSVWIDQIVAQLESRTLDAAQTSGACYQLLMYLSKGYENQLATSHPLFQQYISPTITKIETAYAEDLTVERLAVEVFITPQYLTRLFRRFTGKTTQQYLLDTRLNKAKALLMYHQERSVETIASQVGFSSVSRFVQVFKEKNGVTPGRFRRG